MKEKDELLKWEDMDDDGVYHCPKCKEGYGQLEIDGTVFDYCPHCGQKLSQP